MGRVADGVLSKLIEIDFEFGSSLDRKLGRLLRTRFFNGASGMLVGAVER